MASRAERRARRLASVVGVGALLLAAALLYGLRESRARQAPEVSSAPGMAPPRSAAVERVVIVSLDGLSSAVVRALGPTGMPVLHGLAARGSYTWDARADRTSTETIPNHTSMITGRAVREHGYTDNTTEHRDPRRITAHGLFDVARAAGLPTALLSSKAKFLLFAERWADQLTHVSVGERDDADVVEDLVALLDAHDPAVIFVHLASADRAGHDAGWSTTEGTPYVVAARRVDALLGIIVARAEREPGRTALVITSDHGGRGPSHLDATDPECFTIPLVLVVPERGGGRDLYAVNAERRAAPGPGYTSTSSPLPPIRSAEVANITLGLLGLPSVAGSTADAAQELTY